MIATSHPRTRWATLSPRCLRRPARVLVAEDDAEARRWLAEMLSEEGFDTVGVPDGLTAIVSLLAEGADVVVTDWKMPGFDGRRLLESVRRLSPKTPVIFVSAFADPDLERRLQGEGAYALVPKPFRRDDLLRQVHSALSSASPSCA